MDEIVELFKDCSSPEERYKTLIGLGQTLEPFPEEAKKEENLVPGCQSLMYLISERQGANIVFYAYSDALISAGLAALMIRAYSGKPPQTLIDHPPTFLNDLGILASLSPGRSSGLRGLYLAMQAHSLRKP